jgi:hypothetical protein
MSKHRLKPWQLVVAALGLAALACSGLGGSSPTEAPTAAPTEAVEPTEAPRPTATERPTAAPAATDEPQGVVIPLEAEPYVHPSGAFTQILPVGWSVDERDDGIFVNSPDDIASIDVSFTNVGVEFTEEEFNTYVEAFEANWFGGFNDYERIVDEPDGAFRRLVGKKLILNDVSQSVMSLYFLEGTVVYQQDLWVITEEYDAYFSGVAGSTVTLQTDATAGAQSPVYVGAYRFTGPGDLFEFFVPYGWEYTTDSDDTVILDTFTSPDGLSQVENIVYDDGTTVSKSQAGAFALSLLKQFYEIDDIRVTADEVQPDGSERLTWTSASKGWEGQSFFETRGTSFLLLTWIVTSDMYDIYEPVWTTVVDTYTIP